jgi:hypothetical protein
MQISKSDYMLFLRHPAWLWLKKHDKSKLPVVDDGLQAIFDDGKLFEEYVNKLFPTGVRLGNTNYDEYLALPLKTKQELEKGTEIILQGRIEAGNITCIFDVLQKTGEQMFDLFEIKSSTEVKDDHIQDLAFQTVVLENAGLKIRRMYVIYVNRDYIRKGEIDIRQMTTQSDVTEQVRSNIETTKEDIKKALAIIESPTPPDFSPRHVGLSALSEWMAIFEILKPEVEKYNIYKLTRLNPKLIGELEDLRIKLIADIPSSVDLNSKQQLQVKVTKEDQRIVDRERIQEFISQIRYPLYFFDYETFGTVIPPFDKTCPYQQVPFQYSLFMIEYPQGPLIHKEFLHTDNSNPCVSLLEQLKRDIGESGTVFVWFEGFEKGRNEEMGEMFPEYAKFLEELNARIVDLMIPFSNNWFVDKDFFGSASLKKVFPALITEYSYKNLAIREGGTASRTWKELIFDGKHQDKKDELIKQLLEYCRMDTLAMVQLFKFLQSEIS